MLKNGTKSLLKYYQHKHPEKFPGIDAFGESLTGNHFVCRQSREKEADLTITNLWFILHQGFPEDSIAKMIGPITLKTSPLRMIV